MKSAYLSKRSLSVHVNLEYKLYEKHFYKLYRKCAVYRRIPLQGHRIRLL